MEYEKYLPDVFRNIEDYRYFGAAADRELSVLWQEVERFPVEMDIFTMEENLSRWENILSLSSEEKSLEERRKRLISRLNVRLPYTPEQLYRQLALVFEGHGIEVLEDPIAFSLTIGISDHLQDFPGELQRQLRDAIPANLTLYLYGLYKGNAVGNVGLCLHTADSLTFTERSSNG